MYREKKNMIIPCFTILSRNPFGGCSQQLSVSSLEFGFLGLILGDFFCSCIRLHRKFHINRFPELHQLHHISWRFGRIIEMGGFPARHLWFPEGIPVDWFYVCRMIHPYYLVCWGVLQHGKAVQQPCRYPMFCLICGYRKSYIEIIESDTPCGIFHDFFMTYPLVNVHITMENHIFNNFNR